MTPRALLSLAAVGSFVVAVAVYSGTAARVHTDAAREDRRAVERLEAENARLKGIVEAQKDTIRRYEEFIAWQGGH